jgi:dTDP-glucose pyrophosphorylase
MKTKVEPPAVSLESQRPARIRARAHPAPSHPQEPAAPASASSEPSSDSAAPSSQPQSAMPPIDPRELFVRETSTIQEVISAIDRSRRLGIALVVDADNRLINTLTDGDVRRGILNGHALSEPATKLLSIKKNLPRWMPVVAFESKTRADRLTMMQRCGVRQLPILDAERRVVAVESLHEMTETDQLPLNAVVMAGGFGKRLLPLTVDTPKPMLLVGGRPVLEHIVGKLSQSGINRMQFTTYFRPEKIVEHFGDGKDFGVDISYLNEDNPLGTAGALSLLKKPSEDVLVMNGDVLSTVDFVAMFDYHRENQAVMTLGVFPYEHTVPYGVVEYSGQRVTSIKEKPCQRCFVNGGIYILSPAVFEQLTPGERLDMPELINRLLAQGKNVVTFPIREEWIDIGRPADFERANQVSAKAS